MASAQPRGTKRVPHKFSPDDIPDKLSMGIDAPSLSFPSSQFCGDAKDFSFENHSKMLRQVNELLARNNMHLRTVGVDRDGSFAAIVGTFDHPVFVWGFDCERNRHHLYFQKQMVSAEDFLNSPTSEQDLMLREIILQAWMIAD